MTPHTPGAAKQQRLILLTGASGYIGGRLLRTLHERGERVRALAPVLLVASGLLHQFQHRRGAIAVPVAAGIGLAEVISILLTGSRTRKQGKPGPSSQESHVSA